MDPVEQSSASHADQPHILHIFPFSLYSIIARLSYAFGQSTIAGAEQPSDITIENKLVNLHRDENVSEHYLLNVNSKGQVPALTGGDLTSPVTDSLDISYWLCARYPRLLPEAHESEIRRLLSQMHDIQALCLSVPRGERMDRVPCDRLDELLASDGIDQEYREALESKRAVHRDTLETALTNERVDEAEASAITFFSELCELHVDLESPWLLGGDSATLLDAHALPFVARLLDCGREDIVPEALKNYAKRLQATPQWQSVTNGRSTMWNPSMGHVHLLKPL